VLGWEGKFGLTVLLDRGCATDTLLFFLPFLLFFEAGAAGFAIQG
jgi:hypothetical protein